MKKTFLKNKQKINSAKICFFGLTEALIVMASLALLSLLMISSMKYFRSTGGAIQCADTVRMLTKANIAYANDTQRFAPAAIGDSYRWYGEKEQRGGEPHFEFYTSPLFKYLEGYKKVDFCPALAGMLSKDRPIYDDRGGFGYGYNENIGSLRYTTTMYNFWDAPCQKWGLAIKRIKEPDKTVMFTDTATKINKTGSVYIGGKISEFGFCKSYNLINMNEAVPGIPDPSIHFRHDGKANVSWVDGHVSLQEMSCTKDDWGKSMIGFFGPKDNSMFDPN